MSSKGSECGGSVSLFIVGLGQWLQFFFFLASIPKVISQNCESCTPEEASNAKKIVGYVKQNYPDVWKKVAQRYSGKWGTNLLKWKITVVMHHEFMIGHRYWNNYLFRNR